MLSVYESSFSSPVSMPIENAIRVPPRDGAENPKMKLYFGRFSSSSDPSEVSAPVFRFLR